MNEKKPTRLQIALADLIELLRVASDMHWVNILERIERNLEDYTTQKEAVHELESCFGGMGSLNDMFFCRQNGNLPEGESEETFNKNFNLHANRVFKELRLFRATWFLRLLWHVLEWIYRRDPPPRIKNSFRKN